MADSQQGGARASENPPRRVRDWSVAAIVATLLLTLDLWSKQWVWDNIRPPVGSSMMIWEPHLEFSFAFNTGVAFGMMSDLGLSKIVFVVLAILAIGYTTYMVNQIAHQGMAVFICLGAIVSGALGNLVDRLMRGGVVDFIKYNYPWGSGSWPNFNVADIALVVGIAILMFYVARTGGAANVPSEARPSQAGDHA